MHMNTTITLVVSINAKPECREQLKVRLLDVAVSTRKEAGNIFYIPHETDDGTGRFIIYERWADQAALDVHMSQAYLTAFLADSEAWLSNPIFEIICREM